MSLITSKVLPALQERLPKVISPRHHGLIDYAHAAFFFTMGVVCRRSNRPASNAALATGGLILLQSMLTDYPFGVEPVLSFQQHGEIDAAFASASWVVPELFGFEGTLAARVYQANSLAEATIVGLTDWDSDLARQQRLSEI